MKIDLYPYQKIACQKIVIDLDLMPHVLLHAATGAGKTVLTVAIIERFYLTTSRNFLVLAHKQELVEQFYNTFSKMSEVNILDIGICCAGLKIKELGKRIIIGTIQTFINEVDKYVGCNLLIIDEVHRVSLEDSQYKKVFDVLKVKKPNMRLFGITATPARKGHGYIYGNKCKKGSENLFPVCNHHITYHELVASGHLMQLEGKICMDEFFLEELNEITIGSDGDYQENELGRLMSKSQHLDSIKKALDNHCQESKHICIFCCTISHAQKVHDLIYGSTIVHSQLTPLERSGNMSAWKSGQIKIMVSVNILLEGFDFPALDTLIFVRPTLSSNLYIQAIGRVVRISPGKTKAMLIDLTNNTNYFGSDIDNIKVSIPKTVEKEIEKEEELSSEKRCPQCQKEIHKALKTCIYCGYEFENVIEYINNLPVLKDIKFKKDEEQIELYPVVEMFMSRHQKEGKPDSVKVEYRKSLYGYGSIKEFLCFDHGGYAAKKAKEWWMKMSFGLTPPENVDIALEQIKNIVKPTQIKIQKEGKYWRVIEYIFDETAFYGECNN